MFGTSNGEFILGNPALHAQLSTALAAMTHIVCNPSRPPTAQQLADTLDVSVRYLRKLLRTLSAGGLLQPHPALADAWSCTRAPHAISLADIYASLAAREESAAPFIAPPQPDAALSGAELLMMQATTAINQVVIQHLQRFDLGRLKAAESAMLYTASLRAKARRGEVSAAAT